MTDKEEKIQKAVKYVQETDLSAYKIWQGTKITEASIGNYKSGKTKPTLANAEIIINYFEKKDSPIISSTTGVPYYEVDFIGGFNIIFNDQTTVPTYLIDFKKYNDADCWCNITGHSMEPEITHGDIIALKEVKDWKTFLPYGEVYAIVTKEHRTIKRVTASKKEGYLKLVPTNKSEEYAPQDIPESVIMRVFKVLGCMKKL